MAMVIVDARSGIQLGTIDADYHAGSIDELRKQVQEEIQVVERLLSRVIDHQDQSHRPLLQYVANDIQLLPAGNAVYQHALMAGNVQARKIQAGRLRRVALPGIPAFAAGEQTRVADDSQRGRHPASGRAGHQHLVLYLALAGIAYRECSPARAARPARPCSEHFLYAL